ncbi:MAG: hypothetical protein HQ488_01150 [Parcubacteria group bacterium]|nr:hypothetical protein [Parcubacteria group bacterium]
MTYSRTLKLSIVAMVLGMMAASALSFVPIAMAQDPATTDAVSIVQGGLNDTARGTFRTTPATEIVGNLIAAMLSLTGILFLVLMVYAGILYMTAAGEEAKVKKAKGIITTSVIGIVIVVASYAITSYIVTILVAAT